MSGNSHAGKASGGGFLDRVPLVSNSGRSEERASTFTHAVGTLGSIVAAVELLRLGLESGSPLSVISLGVFGLTLINLYAVSTVYHFLGNIRAKKLFRILDHVSVLYLIAGSYTAVVMLFLHGPICRVILFIEWGLAVVGTLYKILFLGRARGLSIVFYLVMGWLALVAWPQMILLGEGDLTQWLLAGGAAYTVGLTFFGLKRLPYNHAIWHLFVIAGSACHVIGIYQATKIIYG